jgi:hypothetical protein
MPSDLVPVERSAPEEGDGRQHQAGRGDDVARPEPEHPATTWYARDENVRPVREFLRSADSMSAAPKR